MRSTITLSSGGSFNFVPPSFTNSAATPSFFPTSFTRARNAGGNAYSLPHSSPTFFMVLLLRNLAPELLEGSIHRARRCLSRFRHRAFCLRHDVPYDGLQIAGLLKHAHLPLRARSFVHDRVHVLHRAAAAEIVHHVIHEFQ